MPAGFALPLVPALCQRCARSLRALVYLLLVNLLLAGPAWAQSVTVTEALTVEAGAGQAAYPEGAAARAVTLPDEWARTRPGFEGALWYRVSFQRPPPRDGLLAVAIRQVCSNFEVHLNGHVIHSGGRMVAPLTDQCHHPQLVPLPAALLVAGANRLDLKVAGVAREEVGSRWRAGGLSALTIGPLAELEAGHTQRLALGIAAPQGASATLLLLGGFMFVLGFVHRRESHLAYFGALVVGLALLESRLWLRQLPLAHQTVEFLLLAVLGFMAWAGVQFLLRYAGTRIAWLDKALPAQCALIVASALLAGPHAMSTLAWFWYAVLTLEFAAAGVWHLRLRWHSLSGRLMGAVLAAIALALALLLGGQWMAERSWPLLLAPLVPPAVAVLVGLRLAQQHGRALQQAEQGKLQLEQRVREATAEIERNFRQLSELRVEQVTERERKRIAADLHDDLGAKLLTIVHTSESERISTLAREALEEMRLSVRGLTGKPVRLADALGDWRAETVSRLAQAGIEGEWQAQEDLPHLLSARAYVQTTRILREATSNIIKHSNATHCSVRSAIADGDFMLVIQDNGDGISPDVEGRLDRGHGLASMKNRAKQLQGQCLVESGQGYGTVIRLTLPLDRATGSS
jgi:two-component system, NarL family, sensor histidine kinase UhpB